MNKVKNIYQSKNYMLNDAFDRIVAQIHMKKQKDQLSTFAICGTQPGVGTTSIAINLAISMAMSGWKTLLIDGDLRKISKEKRLGDSEDIGLAEYLSQRADLEEVVYPTNYEMLSYIPSGIDSDRIVSDLCSVRMQQLVQQYENEYDYVIIDTPAMSAAVDGSIVGNIVDGVVLVTSQRKGYTIKAIKDARRDLERVGANILGIVVNQVDAAEYRRALKNYDYFKKRKYITKKGGTRA